MELSCATSGLSCSFQDVQKPKKSLIILSFPVISVFLMSVNYEPDTRYITEICFLTKVMKERTNQWCATAVRDLDPPPSHLLIELSRYHESTAAGLFPNFFHIFRSNKTIKIHFSGFGPTAVLHYHSGLLLKPLVPVKVCLYSLKRINLLLFINRDSCTFNAASEQKNQKHMKKMTYNYMI